MAHHKNTKKTSQGLCQKIYNAITPSRSRTGRLSHRHDKKKTLSKNPPNPVRMSSVERDHVRVPHQPSLPEREIEIVGSQKFAKSATKREKFARPNNGKDDSTNEKKFPDYISKVNNSTMMKTVSGGDRGGGTAPTKRDSFNDRVTSFINRTRIEMMRTGSVGDDHKSFSFK